MRTNSLSILLALLLIATGCHAQVTEEYYEYHTLFSEGATLEEKVDIASRLVPTPQQLAWQQLELTAFIHFGINTFTDQEWGSGNESPALFNPTHLDTDQWVRELKEAGFKMVILTAKHHDGFCLWPTSTTPHSVASSPWKEGKGDVVAELASSCHKYGMKLGIYLSPWDRNHPTYGTGEAYNKVYLEQLRELLSNYGRVDEVWFDGANGEGPNGKKQEYDWVSVLALIKELQPNAVTAIMGTEARWVGNERGYGRATEWSATVLPPGSLPHALAVEEQLEISATSADLGSRALLEKAEELFWYPSEVDVSIRPGWFYHQHQDNQVKSLAQLAEIYFSSVGMNSSLLLNIPPNKEGRLAPQDVERIRELGQFVQAYYKENVVTNFEYASVKEGKSIEVPLNGAVAFSSILLQEDITRGQRVEHFVVEAIQNGAWKVIAEGTTIGYKRILLLDEPIMSEKLRVTITQSRNTAHLTNVAAYLVPATNATPSSTHAPTLASEQIAVVESTPLTLRVTVAEQVGGFVFTPIDREAQQLPVTFTLSTSLDGEEWQVILKGEFANIINNPIPQLKQLGDEVPLNEMLLLRGWNINGEEVTIRREEVELVKREK